MSDTRREYREVLEGRKAAAIRRANRSYRGHAKWAEAAVVPKYVAATARLGDSILDFGAGKDAPHTRQLASMGFDVTAFEFGSNVVAGLHDPDALRYHYDIVFASRVLNTIEDMPMLIEALEAIAGAVDRGGRAVFNFPLPRYIRDSYPDFGISAFMDLVAEVMRHDPTVVGGSTQSPIFEVRF